VLLPFDLGFTGAKRRIRDPRTEAVAATSWKQTLALQGTTRYAGDEGDPRALPDRPLFRMREQLQDTLDASRGLPDQHYAQLSLYLAFSRTGVDMPVGRTIEVPPEHLWWLAAPGDLLLLSDGVTTHFATLLNASEERGSMQITATERE
jgi:hypothetical protein